MRAVPTTHLLWGGTGTLPLPSGSWALPIELQTLGPTPFLDSSTTLKLLVEKQVSQHQLSAMRCYRYGVGYGFYPSPFPICGSQKTWD